MFKTTFAANFLPNKRDDLESTALGQAFFQFIEQCQSMELNLKSHAFRMSDVWVDPPRIKPTMKKVMLNNNCT